MWKSTPRKPGMPSVVAAAAAISCGALLGTPAWGATDDDASPALAQSAVWTPKEAQFIYQGFTTHFSCDGLRDTVKDMLLQLGARKDDLKVYQQSCTGDPERPQPFPGVSIKMSVLQPAPASPSADTHTVPAHWKTVKLLQGETQINAAGQCELLEQVKEKILPLFTTRNVDLHASCIPYQLEPLSTHLQAEVLVPDQKKAADKQASAGDRY